MFFGFGDDDIARILQTKIGSWSGIVSFSILGVGLAVSAKLRDPDYALASLVVATIALLSANILLRIFLRSLRKGGAIPLIFFKIVDAEYRRRERKHERSVRKASEAEVHREV